MRISKRFVVGAGLALLAGRRALSTPYELRGKRVLITGGSRGLGLALARELAARGARLALMARDEGELARAEADLRSRGAEVITLRGDVTDEGDIARVVEGAAEHYGGLDVLVNNAGIIQSGPLDNMTDADFRECMEVNAFAPLRMTRAALPFLRASRGRMLLIASVAGKVGTPHLAPYSVSKFAAVGLGQVLRAELAPEVSVTTVCPGLMRTGSPRHATIKGQHEKEYALFATADNAPLISLDAAEAARRCVDALVRGDAETMVGGLAAGLRAAQSLAPQLSAEVLALGTRFLPAPAPHDRGVLGQDAETAATRHNPIKREAEDRFNER